MPYTPDNPYIHGDPYSYDLKWLVTQVKANRAALDGLDERIRNILISLLDQHDPVYYSTAQELIDSPQKAGSIAYIEGYYAAGDGGANLYYLTDDYNDIIGADFYLTLAAPNLWALPIILTPFVTPEMFGAYGDGVGDDIRAFETALKYSRPVYISAKTYLLSTPLEMPQNSVIKGVYGQENCIILGNLIIKGRYITISSLTVRGAGSGSGTGIELSNTALNHMSELADVIIEDFDIGLDMITTTWCCTFKNVRFNRCDIGLASSNVGHSRLVFSNVYFNNCPKNATVSGMRDSTFLNCNFGITQQLAFTAGNDSSLCFIGCDFETDKQISGTGSIIELSSNNYSFINCGFQINASATNKVFALYSVRGIVMMNCYYRPHTNNLMPDNNFWSSSALGTANYGAIQFFGGNDRMPRPVYSSSSQYPNDHDFEKGKPICFYGTSIDMTKLVEGAILYQISGKKLCYYNGTNILDTDGNIIV